MTCRRVTTWIDAFVDGELSAEETLEVEDHLDTCNVCVERVRFASALRTSVKRAVDADTAPSAGFEARLAGALRAERERILDEEPSEPMHQLRLRRTALVPMLLAAASTFSLVTWMNGRRADRPLVAEGSDGHSMASMQMQMTPEQVLDELVDYHAAPPKPEITEPNDALRLEPEVGVPVRLPAMKQFGASWEGGGVVPIVPMKNQRAAIFRYRISNHPVTVYIYNAGRVPLRGVLEPRVVHNQPVHVGERRGYSIAAREQRGVGYAIATDLNDDESAELVSTIY
jgi:anti-sigma factor RsiW